jgi:hypothetical protein
VGRLAVDFVARLFWERVNKIPSTLKHEIKPTGRRNDNRSNPTNLKNLVGVDGLDTRVLRSGRDKRKLNKIGRPN